MSRLVEYLAIRAIGLLLAAWIAITVGDAVKTSIERQTAVIAEATNLR